MVDVASKIERTELNGSVAIAPQLGYRVVVLEGEEAVRAYGGFARAAICGPAQTGSWVSNWRRALDADVLVATLYKDEAPLLALPLETQKQRGFCEARYIGGKHANGNFAALSPASAHDVPDDLQQLLSTAIHAIRPDIDLLRLERQEPEIAGHANPLIGKGSRQSPNIALASDLSGGFDAFLSRHSGKRKRKKHRLQTRKLERHGGHRHIVAETPDEVVRLLDAFFAVKSERFASLGIADAFADPRVRDFFKSLFAEAVATDEPGYLVQGLEVGGHLHAITGSSICGDRIICEFSGFSDVADENTSPGEYLFFENIQWACEKGFAVHDFSVGDEIYKRQWCSIETVQFDTLIALTGKGRLAASALRTIADTKRRLKSSPALWNAIKVLRQIGRGDKAASGR